MGKHGPEPAKRFRRNTRSQIRYVPLKVGADKVIAPRSCSETSLFARKLSGNPPLTQSLSMPLFSISKQRQRAEAPHGQYGPQDFRLTVLINSTEAEPRRRKRLVLSPLSPSPVNHPAQDMKQFRNTVHLIKNHKLVLMPFEVRFGIRKLLPGQTMTPGQDKHSDTGKRCSSESVVLPTCLGPSRITAGNNASRLRTVSYKLLAIIPCNYGIKYHNCKVILIRGIYAYMTFGGLRFRIMPGDGVSTDSPPPSTNVILRTT